MRSSVCTRNSSDGSKRKPFCRQSTPPQCCSGRCSPRDRSTCARWMVGRRSPQNPSISQLTLPPETIPSCYRRTRHTQFQPNSGRHQLLTEYQSLRKRYWGQHLWSRGYWVATSGNVTDEVWKKYIEDQKPEEPDDNFKVV